MILNAYLLFGDIQFFQVVDHLLLEAVVIQRNPNVLDILPNTLFDGFGASLFVWGNVVLDGFDFVDTF